MTELAGARSAPARAASTLPGRYPTGQRNRPWAVMTVAGLTALLTMLDNTVVTVAAPTIAADLHASLPTVESIATGYMLAFACLMLAGGRLADRYGHRRTLTWGLAVFTGASLAAGLAPDAAVLVAARVAQGAGAALVVPAALAIIAVDGDRLRGVAIWTACGAAALALGPVLGGLLSQHAHWSWIFLLNVPAGVAAIGVAWTGLSNHRDPAAAGIDVAGLVTATLALSAAIYALTAGSAHGWTAPVRLAAVVAVFAAVAFGSVERHARQPMIDLRVFAARPFLGGVAVQVLWGLGVNSVYFYTAIYLQDVRGYPPTLAGLAFLPMAAAVAAMAPLTPRLVRWAGPARTVAAGLVLVAAGMAAVALLGSVTAVLLAAFTVIGVGSGLTVPMAACVLAAAPPAQAGVAAGVFGVAREVSGVFGIAGLGVIVAGDFTRGYPVGLLIAAALVMLGAVLSAATLSEAPDRFAPSP